MAYLIKNLEKKVKGEIISITSKNRCYSIELINKCQDDHKPLKVIEVTDYKTHLTIPKTSFWKLKYYVNNGLIDYSLDLKIKVLTRSLS